MKKLMLIALAMLVAVGAFAQSDANDVADLIVTIEPYAYVEVTSDAVGVTITPPNWVATSEDPIVFNCCANYGYYLEYTANSMIANPYYIFVSPVDPTLAAYDVTSGEHIGLELYAQVEVWDQEGYQNPYDVPFGEYTGMNINVQIYPAP